MTERPKNTEADRAIVKWTGKQCYALLPEPRPDVADCCDAPGWCWILWDEGMSGRFSKDKPKTPEEKSGTTLHEEPSARSKLRGKAQFRGVMPLLALLALSYFAIFAFVGLVWFLMGWWP